jgi:hypothetical protein
MRLLTKLKLLASLNKFSNDIQKGIEMKNSTKVVAACITLLSGALQIPEVQHIALTALSAHPSVSLAVSGLASLFALLHIPTTDASK